MQIFDNALLYNPVSGEWIPSAFSVDDGIVQSVSAPGNLAGGEIINLKGDRVIPGMIDAHVHIESSILTPHEYGRLVLSHGVTTVIADPHEIANVAGTAGIDFMLEDARYSPMDIFFMAPSCVPATPADVGGAVLTAKDLEKYRSNPRVLGLGEMMNMPGVLNGDPEVAAKLRMFKHIDGHAPGMTGETLNKYIKAGIRSDHECTTAFEAREKLLRGMYIFLREGDAARNVTALSRVVTPQTASRCCFSTDDRHVDSIQIDGSIGNCVRMAVRAGVPLETALCIATLSAAECFGLTDRGIIAPGRIADFCVLDSNERFEIRDVYKEGVRSDTILPIDSEHTPKVVSPPFVCRFPEAKDLELPDGPLRVIGVVPGEILTTSIVLEKDNPGVQKVVCVERYRGEGFGVGLVKGMKMQKGAIATSISHDAHNIIATGCSDDEILRAIHAVAEEGGGMAVVIGDRVTVLPLPCGGIMTYKPYEKVCYDMEVLQTELARTGAGESAFMCLSFLALTVVPHLKITPRGLFDGDAFRDVPLKAD